MTDTLDNRPQCSVPGCTKESAFANGVNSPSYPRYRRDTWILAKYPELTECFCCSTCHGKHIADRAGVKNQAALTKLNTLAANAKGYSSIKQMEYCEALDAAILHGVSEQEFEDANTLTRNAMANGYATALEYKNAQLMELTLAGGFTRIADYKNSTHAYRWLLNYVKYCENADGRLGFQCPNRPELLLPGMLQVDHIDGNHEHNAPFNLQVICACCHPEKSSRFRDILAWDKKPAPLYAKIAAVHKANRASIKARKLLVTKSAKKVVDK